MTRQATRQNPALESSLRRDLPEIMRQGIDLTVFRGTGTGEEPAGHAAVLTGGRTAALTGKASFGAFLQRAVELQETAKLSDAGGNLALHRVAYWDLFAGGRYHLHIPHPHETETVRAPADEVLLLTINSSPVAPWQGRRPFALMGASPRLMAEIESAVSGSVEWVGRGLIPFPDVIEQAQQDAAIRGLKGGGMLAAIRSKADFATSTGNTRANEFKRVELTPDLESADLNPTVDQLHNRLLAAAGIPPTLFTPNGNAGAMREGYRLFILQTIEPLARTLLPELAKIGVTKLGTASSLSADVAGRARAVGTLVGAGMTLDKALALLGCSE